MSRVFWINNMHSSQRDVAGLIKNVAGDSAHVISSHCDFREEILMTADEYVLEPKKASILNAEKYVDWILENAIEKKATAILAMRYAGEIVLNSKVFASHGIRVAGGATSKSLINLCDNKFAFFKLMKEAGIPVPETYFATEGVLIRKYCRDIEEMGKISCIKPNVGVYGKGFWIFNSSADPYSVIAGTADLEVDLNVYMTAYQAKESRPDVIVMEYLSGVETSVDCVCDNGVVVAHAVRQKRQGMQVVSTGGREFEIAQSVATAVKLDGLVNVQLKEDENGNPHVLEVNTRPSGGMGWPAVAGINLPYAAYCMMNGDEVPNVSLSEPVVIGRVGTPVLLPQTTVKYIQGEI